MTLLAETTHGHAQPVPAVVASAASRASSTSRAPTANCSPQYADGPDRARPAARPARSRPGCASATTTKARASAAEFQRHLRHASNFFLELMDHGLDIETRVRDGLLRLAKDLELPIIATNDLHYTHAEDADAHEVLLCVAVRQDDGRPEAVQARRRRLLPQEPGRDALAVGRQARPARGVRQHAADRRAVRRSTSPRATARTCRASRCPTGETEHTWFEQRGRGRAAAAASRPASRPRCSKQADYEVGVIKQMNFPGYFLVVADFINWAKDNGIRVGPGRGSGAGLDRRLRDAHHRPQPARARADLRALPQPRPRLDARLRRRLRRAPARRGHPLRHREVRQRPRRADRHLRHDQGQAGGQGRRRACSATRSRWATGSPRSCRRR